MSSKSVHESLSSKAANKERAKPKSYEVDTLKTPLTKEEQKGFDALSKEEQKKFIIKKWQVENQGLDKGEQHEISLEDEQSLRVP